MKIRGYGDFQTTRMTHVHYLIKSYHFPSLFQLPKKKKKKKISSHHHHQPLLALVSDAINVTGHN